MSSGSGGDRVREILEENSDEEIRRRLGTYRHEEGPLSPHPAAICSFAFGQHVRARYCVREVAQEAWCLEEFRRGLARGLAGPYREAWVPVAGARWTVAHGLQGLDEREEWRDPGVLRPLHVHDRSDEHSLNRRLILQLPDGAESHCVLHCCSWCVQAGRTACVVRDPQCRQHRLGPSDELTLQVVRGYTAHQGVRRPYRDIPREVEVAAQIVAQ